MLKMIAGLGNPGREYDRTPHNAGFEAADLLAEKLRAPWRRERSFRAEIAKATAPGGAPLLIVKPLTYMNASGESLGEIIRYFKIAPSETLVICDDVNLPPGLIRIRANGGAGGHNGLKSVITHYGTQDFPRIRIGVGNPAAGGAGMVGYVLGKVSEEDAKPVADGIAESADATLAILSENLPAAMNKHNKKAETRKNANAENNAEKTGGDVSPETEI